MSLESTPGLTETSNADSFESEEDQKLQDLIKESTPLSEEQLQFNSLSKDKKLAKLNSLVEQSKVFSSIIADTLFQSTLNRQAAPAPQAESQAEQDQEQVERPKKRSRSTRNKEKEFVALELTNEAKETKQKLEVQDIRIPQPKALTGCNMRDYQLQGMNWLITLYENGLNGILADEMGLGKTLQSISLLAFLYEQGIQGPFLITCPLSTCSNWVNEIRSFAPSIPVLSYVGMKDDRRKLREKFFGRLRGRLGKRDSDTPVIVVSSYEVVIRDRMYLDKIDWKFLIVDEGHRLKNNNCLLIKELKKLRTSNRLLLTGTPLQNNLNELWSLLNFILPDIFHDIDLFQQWFDFSRLQNLSNQADDDETKELINTEIEKNLVSNLHSILRPFLLRRLKKDVIKGLPPKREYIIYANMTPRQMELYKSALDGSLKATMIRQFFKEYVTVNDITGVGDEAFIDQFVEAQSWKEKKLSKLSVDFMNVATAYTKKTKRTSRNRTRIIDDDDDELNRDLLVSDDENYKPISDYDEEEDETNDDSNEDDRVIKLVQLWHQLKKDLDAKKTQNLMMQLRLICDSPYLFFFPWQDESKVDTTFIESSGKLMMLNQIVPRLIKENHKVLIFSQFTKMLDLIQDWCDFNRFESCRIDGSTDQADRANYIAQFNKDPSMKVFLLSTRAGGLGLNLTAADTVILFDSDWNPQVDLQAMDRVHRIGQTKPVVIYRFATINTVEQMLLAKADSKRRLEKLVISMGDFEDVLRNKGPNKAAADKLTTDLGRLFAQRSVLKPSTDLQDEDNKLSKAELEEIFDRSPAAYTRSSEMTNSNSKFKHIAIFETISAME